MQKRSYWYLIYFQISSDICLQSLLWLISKHTLGRETFHSSNHPVDFLCTCSRLNVLNTGEQHCTQYSWGGLASSWMTLILLATTGNTALAWKLTCHFHPHHITGSLHAGLSPSLSCQLGTSKCLERLLVSDFALSYLTSPWSLQLWRAFSSPGAGITSVLMIGSAPSADFISISTFSVKVINENIKKNQS